MKDFLVILREPDGRMDKHDEDEVIAHRQRMTKWFQAHIQAGHVKGGSALTLNGKQIKGRDALVIDKIHQVGTEIVGGYILLQAADLADAVEIMQTFPVYEFDGYAEIRELMKV